MFEALRIFEPREPITEDYQVPPIDKLGEGIPPVVVFPPDAPIALSITDSLLTWTTVPTATEYQIENLLTGVIWTIAQANIPAPVKVQVAWTGYEWLIQAFSNGEWVDLYASTDDVPTPNLVTTWQDLTSAGSLPIVTLADPIASGGILVSNAAVAVVNGYYSLTGTAEFGMYSGPSIIQYSGTFATGIPYRVRAINSAGNSPASNVVEIPTPSFDCGGNPSEISGLVWTDNSLASPSQSFALGFYGACSNSGSGGSVSMESTVVQDVTSERTQTSADGLMSALICNSAEEDKTIRITISDIVYTHGVSDYPADNGGGYQFDSSYWFCNVNGGTQQNFQEADLGSIVGSPVAFVDLVIPAQSIATINIGVNAFLDSDSVPVQTLVNNGTSGTVVASANFSLAWQ
jgi:hypothetical protein